MAVIVGSLLIALGVLFFGSMNNLWYFEWHYIGLLGSVALMATGIWLLAPRRSWNIWIVPALILIVGGLIFVIPQAHNRFIGRTTTSQPVAALEQQAEQLSLRIEPGKGNVSLGALSSESSSLYTASAKGFRISEGFNRQGTTATATLSALHPLVNGQRQLDVAINPRLPLALTLDLNSSRANLDLRNLNLLSLELDDGAKGTVITLGEQSLSQHIKIEDDASGITLNIPKTAALQLINEDTDELVPGNFSYLGLKQQGNALVSSDFDSNPMRITVSLDDSSSEITIVRY